MTILHLVIKFVEWTATVKYQTPKSLNMGGKIQRGRCTLGKKIYIQHLRNQGILRWYLYLSREQNVITDSMLPCSDLTLLQCLLQARAREVFNPWTWQEQSSCHNLKSVKVNIVSFHSPYTHHVLLLIYFVSFFHVTTLSVPFQSWGSCESVTKVTCPRYKGKKWKNCNLKLSLWLNNNCKLKHMLFSLKNLHFFPILNKLFERKVLSPKMFSNYFLKKTIPGLVSYTRHMKLSTTETIYL